MARIRTIKPDFWTDEKIVELSPFARLLFIGLWNFCDDEGRMQYSPKKIKMQIFPADSPDMSALFGEIRGASLIIVYSFDNIEYLQISNFHKHQKIDKRTASKLPSPDESLRLPPNPTDGMEGNGREWKGREGKVNKEAKTTITFVLPDWIDKDQWELWLKTRKGKKKLPAQMQLQVDKLYGWKTLGLDYEKALRDSASNGWQGLFEPKATQKSKVLAAEDFASKNYGEGIQSI